MGIDYPRPNNEDDFEAFCERFYRMSLKRDSLALYGKRGERQFGIDIFDQASIRPIIAIQCKHIEPHKKIAPATIRKEVAAAASSCHSIDRYYICTTAQRSTSAHNTVAAINQSKQYQFIVEIHYWDDVCRRLDDLPRLLAISLVYGPDFAASLANAASRSEPSSVVLCAKPPLERIENGFQSLAFQDLEHAIEKRDSVIAHHEFQKLSSLGSELTDPGERYAWLRLKGKLELLDADFSEASKSFLAAFDANPHTDQAKQNGVLALHLKGNQEEAFIAAREYVAAGLQSATIATLLVQTSPSMAALAEHQELLSRHVGSDENLMLSMVHRHLMDNELQEAQRLVQGAIIQFPESPHAQFAMAACLHRSAWSGKTAAALAGMSAAVEHYDLAFELATKQRFDIMKEEILVNRAIAKGALGRPDAQADFEAVLKIDQIQLETVETALLHILLNGDYANARLYKTRLGGERLESRFLRAIIDCKNDDESSYIGGIAQLKELASLCWERQDECLMHAVQCEMGRHRFDSARDLVTTLPSCTEESELKKCQSLILNAWICEEEGNQEEAKRLLNHALECEAVNLGTSYLRILAAVLSKIGDFENALSISELVVRPGRYDDDCKLLLRAAQKCRRDDVALRVCRDLRTANSADDKVRKLEVQLLSFYSPEKALELCDDFIVNSEKPEYFRASKNWNAALLKRPEDMTLDKSLLPAAEDLSPQEAHLVVAPLVFAKRYLDALQFLFDLLNSHFDSEHAHGSYVATFLQLSDKLEIELRPVTVETGCAALVKDSIGNQRWIGVDTELVDRDRGWFSPDELIAKELLSKHVGDEIQFPVAFIPASSGTVQEIQVKFLRVFQDCLERFQERFPGSSVIQPVPVFRNQEFDPTLLVASLTSRKEHVQRCLGVYRNELCSLYLLARQLGVNEWQAVRSLSSGESRFVRCVHTTPDEFEERVSQTSGLHAVVLDMTAICTLSLFKLWGRVKRDVELIVGRSTIELLRYWVEECRESNATGTLLLGDDDQPFILERSEEQAAFELSELDSILDHVSEYCRIVSSDTAATLPMQDRELRIKALGYHHIEAICIAIDRNAPLWSDDFLTGLVAEADFGVTRIWTQLAISALVSADYLDEIHRVTARLCAANYSVTIWRGATLAFGAELSGWLTSQSPWKECCEQLRLSSAPLTLKARIVVEFLRCLLESDCPPLLQTGLIQAVFSAVQRNDLLVEIQRRIRQEFRFDARALRNLDVELGYYLDHNVIA